jgi:asparagine synthase (glutamine-hydrolysing)
MKTTIAVLDKHGDNAVAAVLEALKSLHTGQPSCFGVALPAKALLKGEAGALKKQVASSPAVVGYAFSKTKPINDYEFVRLEDAALVFEGRVYSPVSRTAVMEQVAKAPSHCETVLQTLIEEAEGDYSFTLLKKDWIAAGRDPVGVQPLYYGENEKLAALASNRKALWKLGIEEARSFPPGHLAFVNREGFQFKSVKRLTFSKPEKVTMEKAAETLQALLEQSIQRRVFGAKEVAVAFSGGLDSSLLAFIANKCGAKVHLIHVSLENQTETEQAITAADALELPLQVILFKESDVEKVLPRVVDLIEEPDPIKASIGVPFFWTAEKAAEAGFKVLLAGQGADELFGGYQRYVNEYVSYGEETVGRTMFDDVVKLHESNIERDVKICNFHDVELRLPFASYQIAEFAMRLPVELKIERKADSLRKLVLRKVAENIGLPKSIADKPKKAVQYSTGINNAIKNLAKKRKTTVKDYVNKLFLGNAKTEAKNNPL